MFCGNCGKELKTEVKFCPECGNKVIEKFSDNAQRNCNSQKGVSDLILTVIFSIIAFGVYSLVLYLSGFDFSNSKIIIMVVLLSLSSGFGLMRKVKYGEEFNG